MRAKFIYESLECSESFQFQRSSDPRQILNIGQRARIEEWIKDLEEKRWDGFEKIRYTIDDKLNIIVKESLWLRNLDIDWMPDNLTVDGYLSLYNTKMIKLPNNLKVASWIDISGTNITELPNNLRVEDLIYISEDMQENLVVPKHLKEKIIIQ